MKVRRDGNVEIYQAATDPASDCLTEYFCSTMVISARNGELTLGEMEPCPDPATYSYKVTADKLTMKMVKENCNELRPFLFDGTSWRRKR
jgi:hypothetical protein